MAESTSEISLTIPINPKATIEISHDIASDDTSATLDLSVGKNADISITKDSQGSTSFTFNAKF